MADLNCSACQQPIKGKWATVGLDHDAICSRQCFIDYRLAIYEEFGTKPLRVEQLAIEDFADKLLFT